MKNPDSRSRSLLTFTVCICVAALPGTSVAATTNRYWNVGGTGGDGIWGTSPGDKNWNVTPGASIGNTAWPDTINDVAVFQDAVGGNVTVFNPVRATGIVQNGANYTVNAGTITLMRDSTFNGPFISVQSGALTIDSVLAGTVGFTKTGTGNLTLSGSNVYTGTTTVTAGKLSLTGSLASVALAIGSGGNLLDQSGGLAAGAVVTNAGTLTVNTPETVKSYTQQIGGTLVGTAALTATDGVTLIGGTVAGSLLGNTNTTGAVLVSGTLGGGSLNVANTGSLTLAGNYTGSSVSIAFNGGLVDSNGGLAASAAVTNTGTLTVNSADTIFTYAQNLGGTLAGTGILTASGGATLNGGTISGSLAAEITVKGNVTISGSATGSSLSVVQGGTVALTGQVTHGLIEISQFSSLSDFSGGLSSSTQVTNSGWLDIYSDDTVATYVQNGGSSRLGGDKVLTVSGGVQLNGGSVSGKLSGNTTSSGAVVVGGEIGGGTLAVTGGPFSLWGESTNASVEISANARFNDFRSGLDASAAIINHGTLAVENFDDVISTYRQDGSGTLAGVARLTVLDGATLNGGTVSGNLLGNITSTGNLLVSGTVGGGRLAVTGGTLVLTGISTNNTVDISASASLFDYNNAMDTAAILTNAGTLNVVSPDRVAAYTQNGDGNLAGAGILTVTGGATLNGGVVSGGLLGYTASTGTVLVSGALGEGELDVTGGTLTVTGKAGNGIVEISPTASLRDVNGGLSTQAWVSNAGTLHLDAPDEVWVYTSTAGSLKGGGKLSAFIAELSAGSSVAGSLAAQELTTYGAVSVSGNAVADSIRIGEGILTNTGILGSGSTHLDIASGATLVAAGTQRYGLLTTSGTGMGKWQGSINNSVIIAPGGSNGFGNLQVTGKFTNASGGTLAMDVAATGHDVLGVGGTAVFGGELSVNQSGLGQIAPFVPVQLVSASAYSGNFSSLTENLDGVVFFNPENGSITRVAPGSGSGYLFSGTTRNQRSTWISLYDDVIDPGKTNVTRDPGVPSGYQISSGIADEGNPDLLNALAGSFTPAGLDINLLNHLSAEVYTSVLDYAVQTTRQHQRTALSAPALSSPARGSAESGPGYSSKASAKDTLQPAPSLGQPWEFFAAIDYFHAKTDTSHNNANSELSGTGIVAGARNQLTDRFLLAAYVSAEDGSIDGSLIDSDQSGWSFGLIGETLLDEKTRTLLTTAVSYGHYDSDGTRDSAAASSAGWTPGKVDFSNIGSRSLELYAGLETTVYHNERFRVIPTAGLRYTSGAMDGFTESTGSAPGSPIALKVGRDSLDEWTFEMGVAATANLTDRFTLQGQFGFNSGLGGDDKHDIRSRFVKGNRTMSAEADGLTDNLIYAGVGLEYRVNRDVSMGIGYRSDFRPSHPVEQGFNISSAFRF